MRKIFLVVILFSLFMLVSGCVNINIGKTAGEDGVPASAGQEDVPTKTEIKVREQGMEMIISPSQGKVVKESITIKITTVPQNTGIIGFVIQGPGIEDLKKVGPNLGLDEDGSDGWSIDVSTFSFANNEYTIYALAFPPIGPGGGTPPIAAVKAQIIIKNDETLPVEPPANVAPYKVVSGSCEKPQESIELAKRFHANTLAFAPLVGSVNEEDGAVIWEPPEKTTKGCQKLIALAHENGLKTIMSGSVVNHEDPIIRNYNEERFIQSRKEMMKSYAAFAEKYKVSIFVIATEIDSQAAGSQIPNEQRMDLVHKLSKELIAGVKEVYNGKIAIGLVGVEPDEAEASYYPFEGASILCFSAPESHEGKVEESIQNIRKVAALMKKTGEMAGVNEVMLCEVFFFPKDVEVLFWKGIEVGLKELREKQSSFDQPEFQGDEKEFFRRVISEAGPELSGVIINTGPPNPGSVRGRPAENTVAEEFEKWK